MSPARRLGLWALLVCALGLTSGATDFAQKMWHHRVASPPAHRLGPNCTQFVELLGGAHSRGPADGVVRCCNDASLRGLHPLQHGDAVMHSPQGRMVVPQGMSDACRLALGLPLNVNQASADHLARLPGVSPRMAESIVAHRKAHGPFATLDDVLGVHGVGQGTLRRAHGLWHVPQAAPGKRWVASAISHDVKREWLVDVVARLPQGSVSRAWGWLARRERPRVLVAAFKKAFAQGVGITLDDALVNDISAYPSLQALFVRRLRPGARDIDNDPQAVVSPVDALCGATGTIQNGTLLQIKGRSYSLARLLGDANEAARFEGGVFATLYLAPKDYHRIHAPVTGEVREARLIPGALMPVFEESLNKVDELFARNERIITYIDTEHHGRVAVVKVGATLVGCIKVAYDDTLVGNVRGNTHRMVQYPVPKPMAKGADLGVFELGSTVVLLAERDRMDLAHLRFGERVFVGRRIGTLRGPPQEHRGTAGAP